MTTLPQTRQLVLDTRDITQTTSLSQTTYEVDGWTSKSGRANDRLTEVTWTGVDLRAVIGDEMWDTYSKFNITLTQFVINHTSSIGNESGGQASYDDRSLFFSMEGPGWVNNYDVSKRSYSNTVTVGSYVTTTTGASEGNIVYFHGTFIATFDKSKRFTDITMRILKTADGQPPIMGDDTLGTLPSNWPNYMYFFNIFPCRDSRMDASSVVAR